MFSVLRFILLLFVRVFSQIFYRFEVSWVGEIPKDGFANCRLGLLLNHTSLYEPLFSGGMSIGFLWDIASRAVFPGADVTMNKPIAGSFYRLIAPDVVTITRKRDASWKDFLSRIRPNSLILMAPEGRMKRANGLDKEGKPMTVRGGIVDILEVVTTGKMLLGYSGGLHHVNIPGERFPRLFKTLRIRFEAVDVAAYVKAMGIGRPEFRDNVIRDLEMRRDRHCPKEN